MADDLLRYLIVPSRTQQAHTPNSAGDSNNQDCTNDVAAIADISCESTLRSVGWYSKDAAEDESITDMEVDKPTPVRSMSVTDHEGTAAAEDPTLGGMFQVYDMDEFEEKFFDANEKVAPDENSVANPNDNSPPGPISLGVRGSENTIALHEKVQGLGLP